MKNIIIKISAALFLFAMANHSFAAVITPKFPAGLNNFSEGDVIEDEDWNAIEADLGTHIGPNATGTRETLNWITRNGSFATSSLKVGKSSTTTISADGLPSTIPYASSTAITVSGTGFFGTASTTNLTVSALVSGRVPYITTAGAFTSASGLQFDGTKLTATYASTTSFTSSAAAYLATGGDSVGIGTTSPAKTLSVAGLLYVGGTGTSTVENNFEILGNLYIGGNLTATVRFTSSGDTTINGNLSVTGTSALTGAITASSMTASMLASTNGSKVLTSTSTPTAANYLATSSVASVFPYASSTALTVSGVGGLYVGTLTGYLKSTSGAVTAQAVPIPVADGGTGAITLTGCLTGNGTGAITGSGTCNTSAATVTSIATTYPVTGGTITTSGTIALAFGTTTSNTWAGTQTFGTIANTGGYTQSGTTANTFTGTPTFSNATYSALFTGGNVGIGTTSPTQLLSVSSTGGNSAYFAGNVGVGKSNPTFGVDVTGSVRTSSDVNAGSQFVLDGGNVRIVNSYGDGSINWTTASNNPDIYFKTNSLERMRITNGGNVGIGTTSPLTLLDVQKSSDGGAVQFRVGNTFTTSGSTDEIADVLFSFLSSNSGTMLDGARIRAVKESDWTTTANEDSALTFQTRLNGNTTEVVRINSSGNVGIGTTTPGNKLSIVSANGSDDTLPALGVNGGKLGIFNSGSAGGINNYGLIGGVLSTGNAFLQVQRVDGTATAYNMLLQPSGGNVGIGTTSPGATLAVQGNGLFAGTVSTASLIATSTLILPNSASQNPTLAGQIAIDTTAGQLQWSDGVNTQVITGTTSPAFNLGSTTLDAMGNRFSSATSTFLIKNDPEPFTLVGFYCTASTTGTALVRFIDDSGNATETGTCTTGSFTQTVTNNTFTSFEGFNVQASSTKGNVNRITVTTVIKKTAQ